MAKYGMALFKFFSTIGTWSSLEKDHATKVCLMLGKTCSVIDDEVYFRYILQKAIIFRSSPSFRLYSLSQPLLPVSWVRPILMEGTPLLFGRMKSSPLILVQR